MFNTGIRRQSFLDEVEAEEISTTTTTNNNSTTISLASLSLSDNTENNTKEDESKPASEQSTKPVFLYKTKEAPKPKSDGANNNKQQSEEEKRASKKEKTKRRNANKAAKQEQKRRETIEELERSGPSLKEQENAALDKIYRGLNLSIVPIPSDGHCMYRAINYQLERRGLGFGPNGYLNLRKKAADYMRANPHDFMPFVETESGDMMTEAEFMQYCDKVERTGEWGGHLELQALANALKLPISVFTAESDKPLIMGENYLESSSAGSKKQKKRLVGDDVNDPIALSFHRYECALGEHYNALVIKQQQQQQQKQQQKEE